MSQFSPLIRCHHCGSRLSDAAGNAFHPCDCPSFQREPQVSTELIEWADTREQGLWRHLWSLAHMQFLTILVVFLGIDLWRLGIANFGWNAIVESSVIAGIWSVKVALGALHHWHDSEKKWRAALLEAEKSGSFSGFEQSEIVDHCPPTDQNWLIPAVFINYCRESSCRAASC